MKYFYFCFILILPSLLWAQPFSELKSPSSDFSTSLVLPKMKWKGDLRVRAQQETTWSEDSRTSERLRLRFGVQTELTENLKAEIRLATSRSNSSTNQTLGDNKEPGAPRRFIGLDLAYGDWKALPFLKVTAGRIPQSHYRPGGSQLLLDSDIALEGAALSVEHPYSDSLGILANFGSSWIRENYDSYYSQEQTDNMLNWGQVGLKWKAKDFTTTFGAGFFNYTALQGMKFSDVSTGGTSRGNSEAAPGIFKNNFNPRQYFIDSKFKMGSYQFGTFIEHLINGETADDNNAWWVGVSLGRGSWSAQLAFAELSSDAVPGIFTDSDFAGGTTASKGYVLSGQWKIKKQLSLGLSQYMNRKQGTLEDTQYARTHLDLIADF